jgi:hypothetical protein
MLGVLSNGRVTESALRCDWLGSTAPRGGAARQHERQPA